MHTPVVRYKKAMFRFIPAASVMEKGQKRYKNDTYMEYHIKFTHTLLLKACQYYTRKKHFEEPT